jgi:hypothetical protein
MRQRFLRRRERDLRMVDPCRSSSHCRLHHPNVRGSGGNLRGTARRRARWEWSSRSTRSFIAATPSSQTSTTSASIRTGSRSICSSSRTRISTNREPDHGCSPEAGWTPFIGGHGLVSVSPMAVQQVVRPPCSMVAISTSPRMTGVFQPSPASRWPEAAVARTAGTSASGCFHFRPTDLLRCMWRSRLLMLASRRSSSTVASCALRPPGRGSSGADGQRVGSTST